MRAIYEVTIHVEQGVEKHILRFESDVPSTQNKGLIDNTKQMLHRVSA